MVGRDENPSGPCVVSMGVPGARLSVEMESGPNRLVAAVRRNRWLRDLVYRLGRKRAAIIVRWIRPCLERGDRILDVGCGTGNVTELLRRAGWETTPLDVEDLSFVPGLRPVLYDGETIPYPADAFDVALVSTVLHHIRPEAGDRVLAEAARVAPRVIVVEDLVRGAAQRRATYIIDSLLTLEFAGHPHANRSDALWRTTFARLGLRLAHHEERGSLLFLRHALYCLTR